MVKKYKKLTFIFLTTTIIFIVSSLYIFYLYHEEKITLKNTVIPVAFNDYFTIQTNKVNYEKNVLSKKTYPWYYKQNINWLVDTPIIDQTKNLPNGCEVVSATMLLNYYGLKVNETTLADDYLPKKEVQAKDGKLYGPNPALYYAGDPSTKTLGWGTFAPVIVNTINSYLEKTNNTNYIANDETGTSLTFLASYKEPIIIWITTDYEPIKKLSIWNSFDGKTSYYYPNKSHTVLLVGQDSDYYYINDPLKPKEKQKVAKAKLEGAFDSNGRQAINLYAPIVEISG